MSVFDTPIERKLDVLHDLVDAAEVEAATSEWQDQDVYTQIPTKVIRQLFGWEQAHKVAETWKHYHPQGETS